jgi:hypothetical protein
MIGAADTLECAVIGWQRHLGDTRGRQWPGWGVVVVGVVHARHGPLKNITGRAIVTCSA